MFNRCAKQSVGSKSREERTVKKIGSSIRRLNTQVVAREQTCIAPSVDKKREAGRVVVCGWNVINFHSISDSKSNFRSRLEGEGSV